MENQLKKGATFVYKEKTYTVRTINNISMSLVVKRNNKNNLLITQILQKQPSV